MKTFHCESDGWHCERSLFVGMLEMIDDRRFATVIQADNEYVDLLLADLQHARQGIEKAHCADVGSDTNAKNKC